MYIVTKKQKRPSKDIKFSFEYFAYPEEYSEYVRKNFVETGKILKHNKIFSDDQLTVSLVTEWRSRADFLSFVTDEFVFEYVSKSNDYDIDHDITTAMEIDKE